MTSSQEITKKMIDAALNKKDFAPIITDYMRELLFDIGNRYTMTDITQHIVAAAFKMQADVIYSRLDENEKRLCDAIIANSESTVQEIKTPMVYKNGGKE
ncbi:MAG: hypothetical protein ACI4Q6_09570 [Huintestinicola sp.]